MSINAQKNVICHGKTGEGGTGTGIHVEQQTLTALNKTDDLTANYVVERLIGTAVCENACKVV